MFWIAHGVKFIKKSKGDSIAVFLARKWGDFVGKMGKSKEKRNDKVCDMRSHMMVNVLKSQSVN